MAVPASIGLSAFPDTVNEVPLLSSVGRRRGGRLRVRTLLFLRRTSRLSSFIFYTKA
jgi:hypothetical protein